MTIGQTIWHLVKFAGDLILIYVVGCYFVHMIKDGWKDLKEEWQRGKHRYDDTVRNR